MLKLRELPKATRDTHFKLLETRFNDYRPDPLTTRAVLASYAKDLFDYLHRELKAILIGSPRQLVAVVGEIRNRFPAFQAACERPRSKNPPPDQIADENTVNAVAKCFNYETFAKKGTGWGAYLLVSVINIRICPYCHLHHVNYHLPDTNGAFALRPPLDHYFPRTTYPYLAVSLSNLIPSCSQCNSSIKLALDPLRLGLTHPRDSSAAMQISFSAVGSIPIKAGGNIDTVKLALVAHDAASDAHVEAFKLSERYQWYRQEVLDLIQQYERLAEQPAWVRSVIFKDEFVLGFNPNEADRRALGFCLLDVYNELKQNIIV